MGSIRDIFPENLKYLMQGQSSISGFARNVGIERNKLNRYLSGVSSPPPEELKKICDYFNVNADVLLVPIKNTAGRLSSGEMIAEGLKEQIVKRELGISPRRLPSGLYQHWRHSVARPGMVSCSLVRVYRRGEATYTRLIDPWAAYGYSEQYRKRLSREVTGVLLGQSMGFYEICFSEGRTHICATYFTYGYMAVERAYLGHYVTTPGDSNKAASGKEFLEYLGTDTSSILRGARRKGYRDCDSTPMHVQQALGLNGNF